MVVRDPIVFATYYYLHETPNDSAGRRDARQEEFAQEVQRLAFSVAGWLSLSAPEIPALDRWPREGPHDPQPLMQAQTLHGRTNASAVLRAYALRNMLLLRVILARGGEHDPTAWEMLDEALGPPPSTESWLHTARYWCGVAPRLPEVFEQQRAQPIQAPFGVLCLGHGDQSHLLVYPDARTEQRANTFLTTLAPRLDWYPVQARYRLDTYQEYVSRVAHRQQQALDRFTQSSQAWALAEQRTLLSSLAPVHSELDALETFHRDLTGDLAATHGAARELRTLAIDYRLDLMQSGLWSAAPTLWHAEVALLSTLEEQIAADVQHVETTLRQVEFLLETMQTRLAVQHSERVRLYALGAALLALTILIVLIADADLARVVLRLTVVLVLALAGWGGWWLWQRRRSRPSAD